MDLSHNAKLLPLAFDHRGAFQEEFGIVGRPLTPAERQQLREPQSLIWEGLQAALPAGAPALGAGVLVYEERGAEVARATQEAGLPPAMPMEKPGRGVFGFEYGQGFGYHVEAFDPDFAKVLARWSPADDPADGRLLASLIRRDGRGHLRAVVLGRGADEAPARQWVPTRALRPGMRALPSGPRSGGARSGPGGRAHCPARRRPRPSAPPTAGSSTSTRGLRPSAAPALRRLR